jgi:glycosyltransferase involved in cell wall biosynthesis
VPGLLSSLDVAVVCNRDSAFGRYCFPQKLYEAIACRVPVAAAAVGAVAELLAGQERALFVADDAASLLATLKDLLADPFVPALPVPTWDGLGRRLRGLLEAAVAAPR